MFQKNKSMFIWAIIALFSLVINPYRDASGATCGYYAGHYTGCVGAPPNTPTPGKAPAPPPKSVPPPVFMPPPSTPPKPGEPSVCASGSDYEGFKKHLLHREGYRTVVYRDSLGKPTVGVGHLVKPEDGLKVGDTITEAQVQAFLDKDAKAAWDAGNIQAKNAGTSDPCFSSALASVSFQLGLGWRTKFPKTWNLIVEGKYKEAAEALNGTIWQKQTPVRVKDFQDALLAMEKAKKA